MENFFCLTFLNCPLKILLSDQISENSENKKPFFKLPIFKVETFDLFEKKFPERFQGYRSPILDRQFEKRVFIFMELLITFKNVLIRT